MSADILRKKFLDFFKARKHKIVESDSLVPGDDPTVLFTPAGMNQFKQQFMGNTGGARRAASSQRCLRTDDLDKVGKKPHGHHTFFEMLGNFSFGDYFKKQAISWSWEFLTQELKISPEKLWVSVYKEDKEALGVWRDVVRVPAGKIVKLGDKENFWPSEAKENGPNGPCGPCSEIFFDWGKSPECSNKSCDPSCDCGRFVEVWNLVFTQYNRKSNGKLEPLPKKNIDTGMGLERLAAVMQGKRNNFETELFQPIIKEINLRAVSTPQQAHFYAVSDHLRAITFAIYDGVMPSNEGRGYVVRKLIRKSVLHLRSLKIKKPYLNKLVPVLSEIMKKPYPELEGRKENIAQIILSEERSFAATLDSSDTFFRKEGLDELVKKTESGEFSEKDREKASILAFQFHDTYGIPWGLTNDWAHAHGIKLSRAVFDRELKKQRERSKLQSVMKGDVFSLKEVITGIRETKFSGHKESELKSKILRIIRDGKEVKNIVRGESAQILLDNTVFYAESGGQVGDSGWVTKGKNKFEVINTRKLDKVIIHEGRVREGVFKKSDQVNAAIDLEARLSTARNHTATHLLQAALRKVLGAHIQQQGSLVGPDRLRFDFTHFKDLSDEELQRVEEEVYDNVIADIPLKTKTMDVAAAKKSGALAFFGEKYSSKVRVVSIEDISSELCGGTHLDSTGQIGFFSIIREGSVASGVRRIEAVTGKRAYNLAKENQGVTREVASILNVPQDKIPAELQKRLSRIKEVEKQLGSKRMDSLSGSLDQLLESAKEIKGAKVILQVVKDADMDSLRKSVDLVKEKADNAIIALGTSVGARALLVIGVTEGLVGRGIDASKLISEVASFIGGSGGGRKDFAQAGGSRPQEFGKLFGELAERIEKIL